MIKHKTVRKAAQFAALAHSSIDHRRRYTFEPYIVHPASVANTVSSVTDDYEMVSAAFLHDTIEDVHWVTLDLIRLEFGIRIATLVDELTDVSKQSDGNRAVRKNIDLKHTKLASPEAKTIKLADLIDNTKSIVEHAKSGFAYTYLKEKRLLLDVLKEGDARLWNIANKQLKESIILLDKQHNMLHN